MIGQNIYIKNKKYSFEFSLVSILLIDYVSVDHSRDLVSGVSGVLYVALKKLLLQPERCNI